MPIFWASFIASALLAAGCGGSGDDLPRQAISGKVTLDGKPLPSGSIQFDPEGSNANQVAVGGAIADGYYSIPGSEGPTPGTYRVSVYANVEEKVDMTEAPGAPPRPTKAKPPIPKKYNTDTTLKAEVKAGSNAYDIEMTSK